MASKDEEEEEDFFKSILCMGENRMKTMDQHVQKVQEKELSLSVNAASAKRSEDHSVNAASAKRSEAVSVRPSSIAGGNLLPVDPADEDIDGLYESIVSASQANRGSLTKSQQKAAAKKEPLPPVAEPDVAETAADGGAGPLDITETKPLEKLGPGSGPPPAEDEEQQSVTDLFASIVSASPANLNAAAKDKEKMEPALPTVPSIDATESEEEKEANQSEPAADQVQNQEKISERSPSPSRRSQNENLDDDEDWAKQLFSQIASGTQVARGSADEKEVDKMPVLEEEEAAADNAASAPGPATELERMSEMLKSTTAQEDSDILETVRTSLKGLEGIRVPETPPAVMPAVAEEKKVTSKPPVEEADKKSAESSPRAVAEEVVSIVTGNVQKKASLSAFGSDTDDQIASGGAEKDKDSEASPAPPAAAAEEPSAPEVAAPATAEDTESEAQEEEPAVDEGSSSPPAGADDDEDLGVFGMLLAAPTLAIDPKLSNVAKQEEMARTKSAADERATKTAAKAAVTPDAEDQDEEEEEEEKAAADSDDAKNSAADAAAAPVAAAIVPAPPTRITPAEEPKTEARAEKTVVLKEEEPTLTKIEIPTIVPGDKDGGMGDLPRALDTGLGPAPPSAPPPTELSFRKKMIQERKRKMGHFKHGVWEGDPRADMSNEHIRAAYEQIALLNAQMAHMYAELTMTRTELAHYQWRRKNQSAQGDSPKNSPNKKDEKLNTENKHLRLEVEHAQKKIRETRSEKDEAIKRTRDLENELVQMRQKNIDLLSDLAHLRLSVPPTERDSGVMQEAGVFLTYDYQKQAIENKRLEGRNQKLSDKWSS